MAPKIPSAPYGFAYLFERFPSFSQTFCIREVLAMRRRGLEFPIFAIRKPSDEPAQDLCASVSDVVNLPEKYDQILADDAGFRRSARRALDTLKNLWGSEEQKRRIYEALWLGPKLKEAGVRHVHTHFAGTGARTAFWLKKLFGVQYSITAHANDIFRDEPPERLAQIFGEAAVVVTVSDFSLRFLKQQYPNLQGKFHRVYNGIEVDAFKLSPIPEGRPVIVSVGRYIEKKGFNDLIDACSLLGDRDFECLIIGNGPLETELQDQVNRLDLQSKVRIAGPRMECEIKDILAGARLFALSCVAGADGSMDNLPTVIMEAMAAGLPVVSTNLAAVPEMVEDGATGFVVPEKTSTLVAEKIGRLLDDPNLAREMGRRGLERCRQLFSSNSTSTSLCKILKAHGAISDRFVIASPDEQKAA